MDSTFENLSVPPHVLLKSPGMSSITQRPGKSTDVTAMDEKATSMMSGDEKDVYDTMTSVMDSSDGDEALKLVGRERETQFSEEYNAKIRRKLVCPFLNQCSYSHTHFGQQGSCYPAYLCCSLLYPVSVCLFHHFALTKIFILKF